MLRQTLSTDRAWERMALREPYQAVLTSDRFATGNLTDEARREFFASGEAYTEHLFNAIRARIDPDFAPRRSLDFGCGVGRIVAPLARRSESVVGVDVAEAMLREARANLDSFGITNAQIVKGDDSLSSVEGPFDLVHSFIVLQHIPVARGEAIFRELLARMHERSVGALHFTYARDTEPLRPDLRTRWLRFRQRLHSVLASLCGSWYMQMNAYDLNVLCRMLQEQGARRAHVEFTKHGPTLGVLVLFRKLDDGGFA
jgi:SAM-dependent methyltransferase